MLTKKTTRVNKKAIYEKYGIEYKSGKINSPIGWINELLKKGNTKTGVKVLTWSMNQTTCKMHCKDCYANFGFYNMANVKKSLAINTELATRYMDFVERAIMAQLETLTESTEIRIHAVGDFFSLEYVEMWKRIIKANARHIFWTYTKYTEHENAFDEFENANIVKSLINGKFNFGHCSHVLALYDELTKANKSVHICRCGIDSDQHCEGCHKCSESEYVLFLEHSTDYKAKEDALYNELKAVINNQ